MGFLMVQRCVCVCVYVTSSWLAEFQTAGWSALAISAEWRKSAVRVSCCLVAACRPLLPVALGRRLRWRDTIRADVRCLDLGDEVWFDLAKEHDEWRGGGGGGVPGSSPGGFVIFSLFRQFTFPTDLLKLQVL